jgi:hypothetical protein
VADWRHEEGRECGEGPSTPDTYAIAIDRAESEPRWFPVRYESARNPRLGVSWPCEAAKGGWPRDYFVRRRWKCLARLDWKFSESQHTPSTR